MSRRNNRLATFERQTTIDDNFSGELASWVEVCKAWVSIQPMQVGSQRGEFIDTNQVKGTRKSIAKTIWTQEAALITTDCRLKVAKPVAVNNENANADENFRIFEIDQIVNVDERNRELQLMVVEKV